MRSTFTLILLTFLLPLTQAQDNQTSRHSFEANLNYFQVMPFQFSEPTIWYNDFYTTSRGGFKYGGNLKYSLGLKKWFIDANLFILRNKTSVREVFISDDVLVNFEYNQKLNYLNPEISFGRFLHVSKNFRLSIALGFGTSFLLKKNPEDISIVLRMDENEYEFYEGQISYYHAPRLSASAQIGLYIPCGKNELSFKLIGYGSSYTSSNVELSKIVNYLPEPLIDNTNGISGLMLGISAGYRFNTIKSAKN